MAEFGWVWRSWHTICLPGVILARGERKFLLVMNRSDYTFREGNERDYESIEGLFRRHDYGPKTAEGWTRWKYLDNPDGPARVFVAEDSGKTIVGVLAYLPRRFTSAETGAFTVMRVVDVFVDAELRKRGVFLPLLEFARSRMDVPKMGVPNDASMAFSSGSGWAIP